MVLHPATVSKVKLKHLSPFWATSFETTSFAVMIVTQCHSTVLPTHPSTSDTSRAALSTVIFQPPVVAYY